MRSPFAEWFTSTFIKRKWTLLTPAGTFLAPGVQWVVNHISVLPADLRTASVWQAPWWLYAICFLLCFLTAQIFAWFEQHSRLREISGKPDVVMTVTPQGDFVLTTDRAALEVLIEDVTLPKPAGHIEFAARMLETIVANDPSVRREDAVFVTEWKLKFDDALQALLPSSLCILRFRVPGIGLGYPDIMKYVLGELAQSNELTIPLTLVFCNSGSPKRRWHSHYLLKHRVNPPNQSLIHVATGEVYPGNSVCSHCKTLRHDGLGSTPLN